MMAEMGSIRADGGFGLYVHWPFCTAKCPYCDFNSHVSNAVDHAAWRAALVADLQRQAVGHRDRRLGSIFFGGGTPSLMAPDTVAAIVAEANRLWPDDPYREVTLEANPTSVEAGRFAAFRDAGVNRVSIGIQSLRDPDLRALGRTHSAREARRAYDVARACFDRVSFDLIYGRPHQDADAWRDELSDAVAMQPDHLSVYQLTIELGTVFARRAAAGRLPGLPDAERGADLYDVTSDLLDGAGLPAYEVSNHARPGFECRHNLCYWRAGDWLGVGPGAHGRYGHRTARRSTIATAAPDEWRHDVARGTTLRMERDADPMGHAEEYLISALRLAEGLDRTRLHDLGAVIPDAAVEALFDGGLAEPGAPHRVRPTRRGLAVADAVAAYLAARSMPARESASHS